MYLAELIDRNDDTHKIRGITEMPGFIEGFLVFVQGDDYSVFHTSQVKHYTLTKMKEMT